MFWTDAAMGGPRCHRAPCCLLHETVFAMKSPCERRARGSISSESSPQASIFTHRIRDVRGSTASNSMQIRDIRGRLPLDRPALVDVCSAAGTRTGAIPAPNLRCTCARALCREKAVSQGALSEATSLSSSKAWMQFFLFWSPGQTVSNIGAL